MIADVQSVLTSAAKAALDPALWPETMWRAGQLVGSDFTVFDHIDKRSGQVTLGFTDRPDHVAEVRERYERYFHRINPRFDIARSLPLDTIMTDDLIGDDKTLGRHEFYVDFLRPSGFKYFLGSGIADDAEQTVVFSFQRSADRGRPSDEQKRDLAFVLPAIRNAFGIYLRTVGAPCGAMLADACDRLAEPLAVLGGDGKLLFVNRVMWGLLVAGDIVRSRRGAIEGASPPIQRAIAVLLRGARDGGGLIRATAPGPAGPLILRLAALAPDRLDGLPEHSFCLVIDDPARPSWPQVEEAIRLFGLTRREATVGTHLAAGLSIDQIAGRLGLSRNTVRSHLALLRDKLGVHTAVAVAATMRRAISPLA